MMKIGWPILYVFLLKPFKAWSFEKLQGTFLAVFLQKNYRFSMNAIQNQVSPLIFCFASFDSFKA